MCGIAGIFSRRSESPDELHEHVVRMSGPLAPRGPDDAGAWVDSSARVAFGFRRLAVIDLSDNGHQPMHSASGRFTIVYNGEVYNHPELRVELEGAGARFRSHCDTEVVVEAIEQWGLRRAVSRFVGMFAFAVWDAHAGTLSLVRDRLGIKPLYVHSAGGEVLFGSELKALMTHPRFRRTLDRTALTSYFQHLYIPAPRTMFERTSKVPAGSILTIRDPGAALPAEDAYWSLPEVMRQGAESPVAGAQEEWVEELSGLLEDAVTQRMRSDVPFGALLSGGMDSSTVVALMQKASRRPVKTFCIGFDSPDFDESRHAAAIAAHLGTDHTEVMLTGADALQTIPRISGIFDEPFADPSQIPSLLVCEVARRDVTVALSGDGGDEIFAGYNRYTYGSRMMHRALLAPRVLRRATGSSLRAVSAEGWERLYRVLRPMLPARSRERLPGEKLVKLGEMLSKGSAPEMYRSLVSPWPSPEALVRGGARETDALDRAFARVAHSDIVSGMLLADQIGYLADDLLAKVDRVSMAVSLEVRLPLIDHRIVEYSWRLPQAAKIRNGRGKWILREVLCRHVPRELIDRPKMGFSVPLESWLRGPLRPWAEELLDPERLRGAGILDVQRVRQAWRELQRSRGRHALGIWAVLMFEAWRETWAPVGGGTYQEVGA